jgi:hypothetical protein
MPRSGVGMVSPCMFGGVDAVVERRGRGGGAVVERRGGGDAFDGAASDEALFDVECGTGAWVASCAAAFAQVALLGSP